MGPEIVGWYAFLLWSAIFLATLVIGLWERKSKSQIAKEHNELLLRHDRLLRAINTMDLTERLDIRRRLIIIYEDDTGVDYTFKE